MTATVRGTVLGMANRANPAFAAGTVAIPGLALAYALTVGTTPQHIYVHVMAGVLWTGIDLFMALVLGPVLGGLAVERASVFRRFTPKMTFLMPTLAVVTIAGGIALALRLDVFPNADPWLALFTAASLLPALALVGWQFDALRDPRWYVPFGLAAVVSVGYLAVRPPAFAMTAPAIAIALGIVTVPSVVGFGVLLPGEVPIYLETGADDPDEELISDIGMRNATLGGLQGFLQLAVVVTMVSLRWSGVHGRSGGAGPPCVRFLSVGRAVFADPTATAGRARPRQRGSGCRRRRRDPLCPLRDRARYRRNQVRLL